MKTCLILVLGILLCLAIPAGAAEVPALGISSVAATNATPPHEASVYISDAQAATGARNWTSVITITTKGLVFYPNDAELFCLQGYSLRKMGQYQKAADAVSNGIRLDPRPVRYANRGYAYLALGNDTAALADAETGIGLNASYPTSYGVRALALQGLGRDSEALAAIDEALALDPESAHYWHVKGSILAASGNCSGAKDALERSLALDPDYNLPWPEFGSAQESLAALDASCRPAPAPTKSPAGGIAAAGLVIAGLVFCLRR